VCLLLLGSVHEFKNSSGSFFVFCFYSDDFIETILKNILSTFLPTHVLIQIISDSPLSQIDGSDADLVLLTIVDEWTYCCSSLYPFSNQLKQSLLVPVNYIFIFAIPFHKTNYIAIVKIIQFHRVIHLVDENPTLFGL